MRRKEYNPYPLDLSVYQSINFWTNMKIFQQLLILLLLTVSFSLEAGSLEVVPPESPTEKKTNLYRLDLGTCTNKNVYKDGIISRSFFFDSQLFHVVCKIKVRTPSKQVIESKGQSYQAPFVRQFWVTPARLNPSVAEIEVRLFSPPPDLPIQINGTAKQKTLMSVFSKFFYNQYIEFQGED